MINLHLNLQKEITGICFTAVFMNGCANNLVDVPLMASLALSGRFIISIMPRPLVGHCVALFVHVVVGVRGHPHCTYTYCNYPASMVLSSPQ